MAGFYSGAAGLSRRFRGRILHRRSQEEGLRESRGTIDRDGTTVSLKFQKRGIDAKLWLSSEAWLKAADLLDAIDVLNTETEITSEKIGGAK